LQRPFVALVFGWLTGISIAMGFGSHFWIFAILAVFLVGSVGLPMRSMGFPGGLFC
jgi:hypothetical protein